MASTFTSSRSHDHFRNKLREIRSKKETLSVLEVALKKRLTELKELCLREGELTGQLPADYPLQPREPIPQVRRRVKGSAISQSFNGVTSEQMQTRVQHHHQQQQHQHLQTQHQHQQHHQHQQQQHQQQQHQHQQQQRHTNNQQQSNNQHSHHNNHLQQQIQLQHQARQQQNQPHAVQQQNYPQPVQPIAPQPPQPPQRHNHQRQMSHQSQLNQQPQQQQQQHQQLQTHRLDNTRPQCLSSSLTPATQHFTVHGISSFQPYQEETKPFQMSDFYKYSSKHKQQRINYANNYPPTKLKSTRQLQDEVSNLKNNNPLKFSACDEQIQNSVKSIERSGQKLIEATAKAIAVNPGLAEKLNNILPNHGEAHRFVANINQH